MKEEVQKAVDVLNRGGVILYPTDTVWGLGCDATNEKAVRKLFLIKKRMEDKSVITLVDNFETVKKYAQEVPFMLEEYILKAPVPTTFILPKGKDMVKGVINKNGSAAFRIPKHNFCQELLSFFKKPLVSTSANLSGEKAPAFFDEITDEIKNSVDYIAPLFCEGVMTYSPSKILFLKETGDFLIIRE